MTPIYTDPRMQRLQDEISKRDSKLSAIHARVERMEHENDSCYWQTCTCIRGELLAMSEVGK